MKIKGNRRKRGKLTCPIERHFFKKRFFILSIPSEGTFLSLIRITVKKKAGFIENPAIVLHVHKMFTRLPQLSEFERLLVSGFYPP